MRIRTHTTQLRQCPGPGVLDLVLGQQEAAVGEGEEEPPEVQDLALAHPPARLTRRRELVRGSWIQPLRALLSDSLGNKRTREESHTPISCLSLPPILRHGLDLDDPFSLAEGDLVLFCRIIATMAHRKSLWSSRVDMQKIRTHTVQLR